MSCALFLSLSLWPVLMSVANVATESSIDAPSSLRVVDILVVDEAGLPCANVDVGLYVRSTTRYASMTAIERGDGPIVAIGATQRVWSATTNAAGRARCDLGQWTFRRGKFWPARWIGYPPRYPSNVVQFAIDVPLATPVEKTVSDLAKTGALHEVRLVLPKTTPLTVEVRDPQNRPLDSGVTVIASSSANLVSVTRSVSRFVGREGKVHFPHVGLGVPVVVRSESKVWSPGTTKPVTAPDGVGRNFTMTLRTGPRFSVLSGQIVRDDGGPVAGSLRVRVRVGDEEFDGWSWASLTGGFQVTIDKVFSAKGPGTIEIWHEKPVATGMRIWVPPTEMIRIARDFPLPAGAVGLGLVRFSPRFVVASGTVVDGAGNPIAGAKVEVTVHLEGRRHPWLFTVTSDAIGSFRLHGDWAAGHVDVVVSHAGRRATRKTLAIGAADIRLELK